MQSTIIAVVAVGILDAGIGATDISTVFSAMNIPRVHHRTLRRRERSVRKVTESAAKRSCQENLLKGRTETLASCGLTDGVCCYRYRSEQVSRSSPAGLLHQMCLAGEKRETCSE